MACEDSSLYVLREAGLRVLDLSDPNEPVWGDVISLSSYLQDPDAEETDLILEEPTSDDDDEYAPYPWEFPPNPYSPYGPGFSMGGGYPSYGLSQSRGYGYGSAFAAGGGPSGPYGYSRGYASPLSGLGPLSYSGSSGFGSYENAVGGLPYGLNSLFSSDCGPLDLPFWLFSGSD